VAAVLMWAANIWLFIRRAFRAVGTMVLPGPHLPLERQMVCSNIGFIYHRNNEFMFLMLGETVLQIVIATHESTGRPHGFGDIFVEPEIITAIIGFGIALTLMAAFQSIVAGQVASYEAINEVIEEKHAEEAKMMEKIFGATREGEKWTMGKIVSKASAVSTLSSKYDNAREMYREATHLLLKIRAINVFADFLWQVNAMAVMLTGVAIKLVLNSPVGTYSAHSVVGVRLTMSVPIATCFFIQLVHATVLKNRHHWHLSTFTECPGHVAVVFTRVALLILGISLTWIISPDVVNVEVARPYRFLGLQSILCVLQVLLLEMQEHKFKITSKSKHPLARVPLALHALRLRTSQARVVAKAQARKVE